ncbi:hypothetical protein EBR77_02370 [bacterium]|nr:hypothetical protein [bacterium]NBX78426.1 hypothetical protein [bacterium]
MKKTIALFLSILLLSQVSVQSAEQPTTLADLIKRISTPSGALQELTNSIDPKHPAVPREKVEEILSKTFYASLNPFSTCTPLNTLSMLMTHKEEVLKIREKIPYGLIKELLYTWGNRIMNAPNECRAEIQNKIYTYYVERSNKLDTLYQSQIDDLQLAPTQTADNGIIHIQKPEDTQEPIESLQTIKHISRCIHKPIVLDTTKPTYSKETLKMAIKDSIKTNYSNTRNGL